MYTGTFLHPIPFFKLLAYFLSFLQIISLIAWVSQIKSSFFICSILFWVKRVKIDVACAKLSKSIARRALSHRTHINVHFTGLVTLFFVNNSYSNYCQITVKFEHDAFDIPTYFLVNLVPSQWSSYTLSNDSTRTTKDLAKLPKMPTSHALHNALINCYK